MTKEKIQEEQSPMSEDNGDFLVPPTGYDKEIAETFADLPYAWRRYLCAREEEIDKGFSELRNHIAEYKWLEDIYQTMSDDLRKEGIASAKDWLHKMIDVEQHLRKSPEAVLNILAETYGVCSPKRNIRFMSTTIEPQNILSAKIVEKQLQDFANGKDEEGNLIHPFYTDVIEDIFRLLESRTAKNLEEAYDMAIWLNKTTRAKMIAKNIDSNLQAKTKEAQKSKTVAFTAAGNAEPDYRNMSLREELEHRFAALGFVD